MCFRADRYGRRTSLERLNGRPMRDDYRTTRPNDVADTDTDDPYRWHLRECQPATRER